MRAICWTCMLLLLLAPLGVAWAQEEESGGTEAPASEGAPAAKATEPAVQPPVAPKVSDEREEVIFERLVGWYFEGRGGVFLTVAGARGYSNGQPFFGFEFGYDITDRFSIQLSYASGYQAANPLEYPENCTGDSCADYHLDFGVTFFNLSADYDILSYERWALEGRLGAGVALIKPSAKPDQSPVDGDVFGGLRFEYYTLLRHFTLGAEYDFYYVIPTAIPAMSISLSVMYNF